MLNVLLAYPYLQNKKCLDVLAATSAECDVRFLLDSGAFTAWKSGTPIVLDEYCKFIETMPIKPWRYFMLDIVGDPEATLRNYETMLARGLKPIPIFTRGDDPAVLEEFYKTTDVVAIGGLVGTRGNRGFVKGIMKHIAGRKVHWLGFCYPDFVTALQPFSIDSSSWSYLNRMGELKIYCGNGRMKSIFMRHMTEAPEQWILDVLLTYDVVAAELGRKENWKSSTNRLMNVAARSWVRRSIDTEASIGTKVFLACSSGQDLELLATQYKIERDRQCALRARAGFSSAPDTAS